MRVAASLSRVRGGGCAKPNCGWLGAAIHRHHKGHQALWLGPWAHRGSEPQWKAFVRRYYEFRAEDICRLCESHHAEIHSIYDRIIADDVARTGLPLYLYSWKQGRILMRRLEDTCEAWLLMETPGIDSKLYGKTRKLRWAILKREARRLHPSVKRPAKKLKRRKPRRRR